ncbi:DUF4350 domain-containing protein [Microbacterium sp. NPDC076911]|uniref:DUF4350 domain-containing protein n=1 Tax=Microbacterium sp. NPDC076911 TaxID=3154958 RepID=UPI003422F55E
MSVTVGTPPTSLRTRLAGWTAIGLGIVAVGAIGATLSGIGEWTQSGLLDPDSNGPNGTRALVEVLRDHAVDVQVVRNHADAERELNSAPATLVLLDTPGLSDERLLQIAGAADDIVLVDPRSRTLDLLVDGSTAAGYAPDESVAPACSLDAAQRSGAITPGALFAPSLGGESCYPAGEGWALVTAEHADGTTVAIDAQVLFTNQYLADNGNAALAINLMGGNDRLVWYIPDPDDTDLANTDPSLGELTPPWVSPVIVLLLVSGLAAAIWRGRRFGPLVAERLPVTVRASETTEGRARMYAASRDARHAADQLRIAAIGRLARVLHLGAHADARDVAEAAASITESDRVNVRRILLDDAPTTDAELVALSEQLRQLEDAVQTAVRPERNSS